MSKAIKWISMDQCGIDLVRTEYTNAAARKPAVKVMSMRVFVKKFTMKE